MTETRLSNMVVPTGTFGQLKPKRAPKRRTPKRSKPKARRTKRSRLRRKPARA